MAPIRRPNRKNYSSDKWIHSVGIGAQLFMGPFGAASNLRLDFAFPTRENRRGDVDVFLHFTGRTLKEGDT